MSSWIRAIPIVLVMCVACSKTTPPEPTTSTSASADFKSKAGTVVDDMAAGRSVAVESEFDATMKSQLPVDKLVTAWTEFLVIEGGYRGHGTPTEVKRGALTVERVPVTMRKATAEVRVTYDSD